MKTLKILFASTMMLSVMSCFAAPVSERQPSIASAAAAFSALHEGGYVVVLRHSKTARDQSDTNPFNLDKCGDQRRLTDTGIVTAIGIGKQFLRSQVAFDKVVSSRFCRAIETAELLDLTPDINKTDDVSEGGMIISPEETDRRAEALRALVSTEPADGKNTIVVTHQLNMVEAFGPTFLDVSEAEFIIFKPNSDGFKQLWRVRPIDISLWRDSIALK